MHEKLSQKATCFLVEAARILRIDAQILVRRYIFFTKEINHRTINHTNSPNNSAITWDTCPVFMISCFFSLLVIICPFYHVPRFFSAQHVSTIDSTWIPRTFPEHSTFGAAVPAKWCSTLPPAPECFDPAWWGQALWPAGRVVCNRFRAIALKCDSWWFMIFMVNHGDILRCK